ncbi:hypothetical protein B0H11DRAFT_976952 [Mycena galericulata]|nr:hypothetical protein B0H11DRAFT_976952 [Mycena galericulata]
MAPRKETWDWKARGCAEFENFSLPLSIKEYIQNVVGQALKDLKVREWSDWKREDLRKSTPQERDLRKRALIAAYPGLLTGPHGAIVKRIKLWEPWYILSATISRSRIGTTTDLRIAVVVWHHTPAKTTALSFYNNHLDANARFSSFTVDGASTSKDNEWAVGEKGKGFILATQFLFECVERHSRDRAKMAIEGKLAHDIRGAVSFRVGHQIGTLKWKKSRRKDEEDLLQAVLDDLTPYTVQEYLDNHAADARYNARAKNLSDEEDADEDDDSNESLETPQLRKKAESAIKGISARRLTQQLDKKENNVVSPLVSSDEVAITVIGLEGSCQPEDLFSAIYGIIPPRQAWRVPGSQVQFFIAEASGTGAQVNSQGKKASITKFYHRDQHVPSGPHLNKLSINYHGDLSLTADRVAIRSNHKLHAYRVELARSADVGFRTIPELGEELALDVLTDSHSDGLAVLVHPRDETGAIAYRKAFEAAIRKLHPEIAADARIYPTGAPDGLFRELGLTPVQVSHQALRIMEASGAYPGISEYSRRALLSTPEALNFVNVKGLERLRTALTILAPDVPPTSITIRNYNKSSPRVVYDAGNKIFAFGLPPACDDHPEDQCSCWVGPFLHDAATKYGGGTLATKEFFRAYDASAKEDPDPVPEQAVAGNAMNVDEEEPRNRNRNRNSTVPRPRKDDFSDSEYSPTRRGSASDDSDSEPEETTPPVRRTRPAVVIRIPTPHRSELRAPQAPPPKAPFVPDPIAPRPQPVQAGSAPAPALPADDGDHVIIAVVAQYRKQKATIQDLQKQVDANRDLRNTFQTQLHALNSQIQELAGAMKQRDSEIERLKGDMGRKDRLILHMGSVEKEKDATIASLKEQLEKGLEEDRKEFEEMLARKRRRLG